MQNAHFLHKEFLTMVDEISDSTLLPTEDFETQSTVIHPVKEVRAALGKLVSRIDTLEADFDRLAEKSSECYAVPSRT